MHVAVFIEHVLQILLGNKATNLKLVKTQTREKPVKAAHIEFVCYSRRKGFEACHVKPSVWLLLALEPHPSHSNALKPAAERMSKKKEKQQRNYFSRGRKRER